MKKLIGTTLAGALLGVVVHAQGTVVFANSGPGLNAPVFHSDEITRLNGANFEAVLFAGPAFTQMSQAGSPAVFLTGAEAGLFNGGVLTVNGVAAGSSAYFQVFAWDTTLGGTTMGASLLQAEAYYQYNPDVFGESGIFQDSTGGPTSPAYLYGLTSFYLGDILTIPEPSALTLFAAGTAALLLRRRRLGM